MTWLCASSLKVPHLTRASFWRIVQLWIKTPEHFVRNIQRCDCDDFDAFTSDLAPVKTFAITRRLIPRIHRENNTVDQVCTWTLQPFDDGNSSDVATLTHAVVLSSLLRPSSANRIGEPNPALKSPDIDETCLEVADFPFYYPKCLGFRLCQQDETVSIEYRPLNTMSDEEKQHLDDILEQFLKRFSKYLKSNIRTNGMYKKRVTHDFIVPKVQFQDEYEVMKKRYKFWADRWQSQDIDNGGGHMKTDPQKHVYEDIAIATFLKCLWHQRFSENPQKHIRFVDVGCGNGFLVNLLVQEGFQAYGLDVSSRSIWKSFDLPEGTLQEQTFFPSSDIFFDIETGRVKQGNETMSEFAKETELWLIGNHADELTGWIPILAAQTSLKALAVDGTLSSPRCKFFVLPCCFYDLSGLINQFGGSLPSVDKHKSDSVAGELPYGRYGTFLRWVEGIARDTCGYKVEREWLRIPSTKNIAFVGQFWNDDFCPESVLSNINDILATVSFKPRLNDKEKTKLNLERRKKAALRSIEHEKTRMERAALFPADDTLCGNLFHE